MLVITMQINQAQVAGILNKAHLEPAQGCARIVSVRNFGNFQSIVGVRSEIEG